MTNSPIIISTKRSSELTKAPTRVLSVDDDSGFLKTTKQILEVRDAFQVDTALSADEALNKLKKTTYDAVVSDYQMPGKDGLQFLKELRESGNTIPFIIFTGKGREELAIQALNLGVDGYFNKMGDPETVYGELAHGIRQAVERVRSEEALKKSEEEYRSLFVNMFNGYIYCKIVLDEENKPVDYVFLEVNDGLERLTGLIKEDIVGKRFTEVLPGRREAHPELLEIYGRVALTGKSDDFVIEFKPSESWLHISVYSPRMGYFVAISEDITERKKAEKELRESEKRYRILFESSREGILFSGSDGKILRVNSAAATILGYDNPEELVGIPAVELYLDPKDRELMFKEIMEKGFVENYEMVAKKRDGFPIHVLCSNLTRSDEEGSILQTEVFITDITERKKTENALLESNVMLAKAQEIAHIGSWVWDIETDKVTWSDELFSIHGLDKEKDAGSLTVKRIQEMTHPDDLDRVQQSAVAALAEGRVHPIEYRIIRPDKTVRVLYGESEPGYDSTHDKPVSMIGIVQDITERKKAEKALEESEEDYRRIVELAPDGIITANRRGVITSVNQAFLSLTGFSEEDIMGKHFTKIGTIRARDIPKYIKLFTSSLRGKTIPLIEFEYIKKDGTQGWGEAHTSVLKKDGRTVGFQAILRDITDSKESLEKIKASEERFRRLVELAPDGIVSVDVNGVITSRNTAASRISGYPKGELIGKHFFNLGGLPAKDVPQLTELFTSIMKGKETAPFEVNLLRKDGTPYFVEVSIGVQKENSKTVGLLVIFRDITERKRAEEAIEDLARFPSENPNPVLRIAKDGTILYANAASKSLLQEWRSKVNGSVPDEWSRHVSNVFHSGESQEIEIEYDGRVHSFVLTPLVDGGYVNAYSRDITERKKASRKLETLNEKLEVVGGLTRHDVNNKLATVRANAYLAKQGLADDNQALEHLRGIESAVGQAEQIFDFAKFYERLGVEELDYMRVEDAVEGACKQFSDLRVRVANDCGGLRVLADSLLNRLFYNLIDNSLKHSLKKSVKIRFCYEEEKDVLRLVYEDDGVGILEVEKEKVFGQDYGKGSGLGLYLIKKMCEVYGWTIEEAGVQGEGVRFIMTLPKVNVSEGKPSYIFKK